MMHRTFGQASRLAGVVIQLALNGAVSAPTPQ